MLLNHSSLCGRFIKDAIPIKLEHALRTSLLNTHSLYLCRRTHNIIKTEGRQKLISPLNVYILQHKLTVAFCY